VISRAVEDKRRHRLHSRVFRFRDAVLFGAEVNDFDIVAIGIERSGDVLLRGGANRASGVVEDGFRFMCLVAF
jgi:hypothetical protein